MTFTGKASTACRTCRQRRIKCDEGRPTCDQCKRGRKECLGYPDPATFLIQNQTNAVIRRAKRIHDGNEKRRADALHNDSPSSFTNSSPSTSSSATSSPAPSQSPLDRTLIRILPNPTIPVQTRAIDFYLTAQLLDPMSHGRLMGHLSVLPGLFSKSLSTSALAKVTTAASVAAFGIVGRETAKVRQTSFSTYGEAVLCLAQAMSDPHERLRNETLLACVLMVVVESLLARDRSPNQQWAAHISGASELLRQRGRNSISHDPVARRLWAVVRGFLSQNSVRHLPEDDTFATDLPVNGFADIDPPPPEARLGMLTTAVTSTKERGLAILESSGFDMIPALMGECQYLDRALCAWAHEVPKQYRYTTSPTDVSHEVCCKGKHRHHSPAFATSFEHHYSDGHLQRLWNSYRVARISLNALMYRAATSSSALLPDSFNLAATTQTLQTMSTEILESIPNNVLRPSTASSRTLFSSQDATNEIALAYHCLWPLYVARGVPLVSADEKSSIVQAMDRIVDKYAIQNGKALLNLADSGTLRPLWCGPWREGWVEPVWEWAFLYGCGAI